MTTLAPSPQAGEDDPWAEADELLSKVASGDQAALAELYDATAARVFGLIRRSVGDSDLAEAILQTVYLDVWKRAPNFAAHRGSALLWLGAIVRLRLLESRSGRTFGDASAM